MTARPYQKGLYLLFFLSGGSGLVYQVLWVRQFGNVFGNTVYSAAMTTGLFMIGLGLGSFAAGSLADRWYARRPVLLVRAYAVCELGIGALALLIALVIPRLGLLSAATSSYVRDPNGWYVLTPTSQLVSSVLAAALILPTTLLMGATLTLLIRYLVREDLAFAGRRVGSLYGVNTAGAALGACATDSVLVPNLGLLSTQALAVGVNLAVGLIALLWSARLAEPAEGADLAPTRGPREPREAGTSSAYRRLAAAAAVALFLSGFAGMGVEILWYRVLITALGAYRATFSLLLTVILVGIWLGSVIGGLTHRRLGHPAAVYLAVQCAFAAVTLLLLASGGLRLDFSEELVTTLVNGATLERAVAETWFLLVAIAGVVGVPAVLMGFSFPLANALVQRAEANVGARAGTLYLANTLGGVTGALTTGFVLLPGLGMQTSALVLASCSVATAVPLLASLLADREPRSDRRRRSGAFASLAVGLGGLLLWSGLDPDTLLRHGFHPLTPQERAVAFSEGVSETICVTEEPESGSRRLYTNGHSMSGTGYAAQRYMRAFAHIPLLVMEQPERVAVICFGVGNTAHAASLHPSVRRIEVVDVSRHVLDHAGFFARWNRNVLRDPRVSVFVNDGRQHLRMQPSSSYDLVTLEPPPPKYAGVSSLYSVEFYELVRSRLRPGGYVSQWLPVYQVPARICTAAVRSFVEVFPHAILLSGYGGDLVLLGRAGAPPALDPAGVSARLREKTPLATDLAAVDLGTLTDLVGTFAGSSASLARVAEDAPRITDDFPLLEYAGVYEPVVVPRSLFAPDRAVEWCPGCFAGDEPAPGLDDLAGYLEVTAAFYASRDFRFPSRFATTTHPVLVDLGLRTASSVRAWRRSGYLQRICSQPSLPEAPPASTAGAQAR